MTAAAVREVLLKRISKMGDMHVPVRDTSLEALLRSVGLPWETNMGGDIVCRSIDACALEALAVLTERMSRLLDLAIRLHVEGVLSEGQVATASGLDRVEIRRRADEWVSI